MIFFLDCKYIVADKGSLIDQKGLRVGKKRVCLDRAEVRRRKGKEVGL